MTPSHMFVAAPTALVIVRGELPPFCAVRRI